MILQLSFSAIPLLLCAQKLSPSVTSTAGNFYQNPALSISQTVGELCLTKTYFNNLILTQGFQQPEIIISAIQNSGDEMQELSVYPNPSDTYIHVITHFNDFDDCIMDISDVHGRIIDHQILNNSIQSVKQITINTSEWNSGLYNLTIQMGRDGHYTNSNRKIMILRH